MITRLRHRPRQAPSLPHLHMTPELCRTSYDMLRTTLPFRRWKLPEGETIVFKAVNSNDWAGKYHDLPHTIMISANSCGQLFTMIPVMAHEMVHLYQEIEKRSTLNVQHNADFRRLAAQVCKHHGFDVKAF